MQRCRSNDVSAVRREIMWRRVRPILAHTNVISHTLPVAKASFSLKAMRGRIALLKHFVRKSGEANPPLAENSRGSLASSCLKSSTYRSNYGRGGGVVGRGLGVGEGLTAVGV